jgi:ATP-dependent Clp protease ATP-binding subunit ClpC
VSEHVAKLRFTTLVVRRIHASELHEVAPVAAPAIAAYGAEDHAVSELGLALSELPEESLPRTVARYLLPDGVRIEHVDVELGRAQLPGRLGRKHAVRIAIVVVPEPRPDASPAGSWVFFPALDHACFVGRTEDLARRVADELAVLPAALALGVDGWKRLVTWAPATLEPIEIELATTPLAQAQGRKALADAERKRLAFATLDHAGRRLVAPSPAPPVVGRDAVLGELGRMIEGPRRSVLLVGEEAAGKTALITAWIVSRTGSAPPIWATSVAELVAGASGLGEWQERVASVLAAAEVLDAILYFDDFGALFADRPAEGGVEIGAAMRRHIVEGRVRVIGELTPVALDRAERRDVSLIGAMQRLAVPAMDPAGTVAACQAWAEHWAKTQPHRPQIARAIVPAAVELARRYLPYRAFPGKAVRMLEELRVAHDTGRGARGAGPVLGESELYAAFAAATGIPVALLADERPLGRADVVAALRRRMVGQEPAVRRVADAICVAKARLHPADKPLASLLFVGPSGVGKTELARSVAAYLFGAPDRMVRLDMSEYTDPWAAERLFGGAGDQEGRLTAAVRSQPFGVVLLDEIEKAHPAVFDLLLQVLGEARLTDGRGRTTFFHNAIIVLTSNLGTRGARGRIGLAPADDDDREDRRYREAVHAAFRPELINRLDQIVVFHPLGPEEIARVAEIAVTRLAERRGFTQSGVILDVSSAALAALADTGFSPELGARALRRHLDAAVLAPCARLLARSGADGHGGTLTVRTPDEQVTRPLGSRLGEITDQVTVALWRRAAATGRRLVRSALALGGLRRDTDRELALPQAAAVQARIAELEATLATAQKSAGKRPALSGPELARLSAEHARLLGRWSRCTTARDELRTIEELCLEALARDVDAVDMIDAGIAQRQGFRRELFWLLTALRPVRPGAMLLVHSPDARAATTAWVKLVAEAARHHGWQVALHLWGDTAPDWPLSSERPMWGPPRDRAWIDAHLTDHAAPAALVRVTGQGADLLLGLEAGLQRFHGLAGAPCHVWIDLLEPRTRQLDTYASIARTLELRASDGLLDVEWLALPGPPSPRGPRGTPVREHVIEGGSVLVDGEELDVPWRELPGRLAEAAAVRLLGVLDKPDLYEQLWTWQHPLAGAEATLAAALEERRS